MGMAPAIPRAKPRVQKDRGRWVVYFDTATYGADDWQDAIEAAVDAANFGHYGSLYNRWARKHAGQYTRRLYFV